MIARLLLRLRSIVLRRRHEREMQEEMAQHLERATARFMERGLSAGAARRAAEREFGNVPWLQDQARDARGTAWLDALVGDLRFALRQYVRRPATTLVMFVVLVAGMSITTLLFSFVHSYATQSPPGIERADDLVRIRGSQSVGGHGRGTRVFSGEEFAAYRELTDHFADVAGWTAASVVLDAGAAPERRGLEARVTFVTPNFFSMLGVRPLVGASLAAGAAADGSLVATAVISHRTWDRLFGRDPDTIGRTVMLNGVAVTIVGVTQERFMGVAGSGDYRLWLPLSARDVLVSAPPAYFTAAARLRPGITAQQATAAAQVVAAAHASAPASTGEPLPVDPSTEVVPLRSGSGDPMFEHDVRLMSAGVGLLALLVLLITCTNVSALLTGLAAARRHEIAIRLSLGAARPRLIRQLLTESSLLACIAAGAALVVVWSVMRAVTGLIHDLPLEPHLTLPATVFTFGVALAVGMLFGLSPALHATRLAVAGVLRDASANLVATRARLQRALVIAQIALTQPLIVLLAALLLLVVGEFQPAPRTEFADRTVVLSVRAWMTATSSSPAALAELHQRVRATVSGAEERLSAMPGVEGVVRTWGGDRKIGGYTARDAAAGPDAVPEIVVLSRQHAHADYLRIMGIPLVRGRTFAPDEVMSAHVTTPIPTLIDVALARQLWPRADPIGRELWPANDTAAEARTLVVIGVIDDPRARRAVSGIDHFVLLPPDTTQLAGGLLLRAATPANALLPTIRALVPSQPPGLAVDVRTLADIADEHERNFRLAAGGVSAAGLAALLLAAIGLYAVVAFSVGQRTREIAVRMAIGGHRPHIVRRFVMDGLRLAAIGLIFGLPVSLVALRALMSDPNVPRIALPPVSFIAAGAVLVVASAAAWIPARRATRVDPAVTLRSE